MAFWCTTTLRERVDREKIIVPYRPGHVKHSAYELSVGREAYITSVSTGKTRVPPGEKIIIPPGQFGLLTTLEVVRVPEDTIAFISIRARIKFRGLVNVSGFHVDPGYNGHLKFAVYNAGSQPVVLDQKQRVFMIWFSELDDVDTEPYKNKPRGRNIIDSDDVTRIQGEVASPAELKRRIDAVEHKLGNVILLFSIIISGVLVKVVYDIYQDSQGSRPVTPLEPRVQASAPTRAQPGSEKRDAATRNPSSAPDLGSAR